MSGVVSHPAFRQWKGMNTFSWQDKGQGLEGPVAIGWIDYCFNFARQLYAFILLDLVLSKDMDIFFLHITLSNTRFQWPLERYEASSIAHMPEEVMAVFERWYLEKNTTRSCSGHRGGVLHRASHGSLCLAHLNPTSVDTSREANRYHLEKMGMTG